MRYCEKAAKRLWIDWVRWIWIWRFVSILGNFWLNLQIREKVRLFLRISNRTWPNPQIWEKRWLFLQFSHNIIAWENNDKRDFACLVCDRKIQVMKHEFPRTVQSINPNPDPANVIQSKRGVWYLHHEAAINQSQTISGCDRLSCEAFLKCCCGVLPLSAANWALSFPPFAALWFRC